MSLGITNQQNPIHTPIMKDPIHELPEDIKRIIFEKLKCELPSLALVNKEWKALADDKVLYDKIYPPQAFGAKEWKEFIGADPGKEPRLPRCIHKDLQTGESLLTLIPEKVTISEASIPKEILLNDLNTIGKLVKNPLKGNKTGFSHFADIMNEKSWVEKSHWVWIKKNVVYKNEHIDNQLNYIKGSRASLPGLIETAVSVFMEYVRSGNPIFIWDPLNNQRTAVRVYGLSWFGWTMSLSFTSSQLTIFLSDGGAQVHEGVVPARRFFGTDIH